jgi:hypothetical protein
MTDIRAIYNKDVARIIRKSEATASRLLQTIRDAYGKQKKHIVTVKEFAEYVGLKEDEIKAYL